VTSSLPLFLNNVISTVQAGSSAIGSATATGINVATGDGANFGTIGTNQFIPAVIVDTSTSPETVKEYVWITARSIDTLTVVRQAEESSRYTASTTSIQAGYTIAAAATRTGLYGNNQISSFRAVDYGWLTWTYDLIVLTGAFALNPGELYLLKVPVPTTMTVSNVVLLFGTSGSALTSGQNFAGLYDTSGTRLAVSADQTTAFGTAGTGPLTIAMTTPITVAGGPGVYLYAAVLGNGSNAATMPTMYRFSSSSDTRIVNAGLTVATSRVMAFASQTSLPSSLTLSSALSINLSPWVALS